MKNKRRDNLLVTMGTRAAYMNAMNAIDLPYGNECEEILAEFVADTVDKYIEEAMDESFDIYIESALMERFPYTGEEV